MTAVEAGPDPGGLVGRGAVTNRLRALLSDAVVAPRPISILGDGGSGKTAVLQFAGDLARSSGWAVHAVNARFSEDAEPYSGLSRLARIEIKPDSPTGAREFMVLERATARFAELGAGAPTLILVDDAHWLDEPSLEVVLSLPRHVAPARLAVVLASDAARAPAALFHETVELELRHLSDADAIALVRTVAVDLDERTTRTVVRQAAGLPAALVEYAEAAAANPAEVRTWEHQPIRAPERVMRFLPSRFAGLSSGARSALLAAAVADEFDTAEATADPLFGSSPSELAEATSAGLISIDRSRIDFNNPFARSAVYYGATFDERAAAHRVVAELLVDHPSRVAWHNAAATIVPDESIADALESTLAEAFTIGGLMACGLALERAAELSPSRANRARRYLQAASCTMAMGQDGWTSELADRARSAATDPDVVMRARFIKDWARAWGPEHEGATWSLLDVSRKSAASDLALALDALSLAALINAMSGASSAREAIDRGMAELERNPNVAALPPSQWTNKLWAEATAADIPDRATLIRRVHTEVAVAPETDGALAALGASAWALDDTDYAASLFKDIALSASEEARGPLVGVFSNLAGTSFELGRWDDTRWAVETVQQLGDAATQPVFVARAETYLAALEAIRGDTSAATDLVTSALRRVRGIGVTVVDVTAWWALGLAAMADGDFSSAFDYLARMFRGDGRPIHYRASYLGLADLAAAAVHSDRRDAGVELVQAALRRYRGTPNSRMRQLFARARAAVAPVGDAGDILASALSDRAGEEWPLERALAELDYGEWLRRQRRINEAKVYLGTALDRFRRLESRWLIARAEAELRACGVATALAPNALSALTPQQLEIVSLAATGMTNKEIADRLYLSSRTVGTHLYRSFPKLGVRGRSQLAALFDHVGTPPR